MAITQKFITEIPDVIELRHGDAPEAPYTIIYSDENGAPIDISNDVIYIQMKSFDKVVKINSTVNNDKIQIENNQLIWSHGEVVEYPDGEYECYIKRVSNGSPSTELSVQMIVHKELVNIP